MSVHVPMWAPKILPLAVAAALASLMPSARAEADATASPGASTAGDPAIVLGGVTVSGRSSGVLKTRQVLTSVDILGADRIEDRNVAQSWELLGLLPGIQLTETRMGAESGKPTFRAFNGEGYINGIKVLIDGIPSNVNSGNQRFIDMVFPLDIDSIEVVRDTNDPRHGLHAIGGSIDVVTRQGGNYGEARLSHFGPGAMVSDGLTMAQVEPGPGGWRVGPTRLGARSFAGNAVLLPTGAPLGDNCLLATRVMVPLDGPLRENIGLLGSPAFEIPRSVLRDRPDPRWSDPAWRAQALRRKTGVNRLTMLLFVGAHCIGAALAAVVLYGAYVGVPGVPPALSLAAGTLAAIALELLWFVLVDRASLGWRPLEPLTCSILEPGFWRHERFWKLGFAGDGVLMTALRGTPFMGLLWRMLGVRVGRQLFDDGASIVEKTMTTLGDHVTLGDQSLIQGHSLEDGLFKSGRIVLGDQVTLGERAFVHYGVQVGAQARIAPESFVMKGEQLEAGSRWQGNPAQATGGAC